MSVLWKIVNPSDPTTDIEFPTPVEVQYTISTLDSNSSGRNQAGKMFRDVVADKRKIQVKWGALSATDCATVLQAIDEPSFDLKYPDAHDGDWRTMTCYVGDRTTPAFRLYAGAWCWVGLSVSFIEC